MNIGFVSTWLERGATYVTKTYMDLLQDENNLFVFARGGEYADRNVKYDGAEITWGLRLRGTRIDWKQFSNWIIKNSIQIVFFNEQNDMECIYKLKKYYPHVAIGSYIDYYKENTVQNFKYYDFLICNTRRHYSVFNWHEGAHYVPWGIDIKLFNINDNKNSELTFFHSMGMSSRKGTDILIKTFIDGKFYNKNSRLIIHSQKDISDLITYKDAEKYNIQVINKEVPHPGLYYLGDIYVYPTTLDGLGLTIYEALASGLPVITTDVPPLNEVISSNNGRLIDVKEFRARGDAYYWPLAYVDENSLVSQMQYYIDNYKNIDEYKLKARKFAETFLDIQDKKELILEIFRNVKPIMYKDSEIDIQLRNYRKEQNDTLKREFAEKLFSNNIKSIIRSRNERVRRNGV